MHSNNSGGGTRYGNHLGLGGGPSSYLSTSLGAASPSDIGGFGPTNSGESAFATTLTTA
jgi:hypothetical protein